MRCGTVTSMMGRRSQRFNGRISTGAGCGKSVFAHAESPAHTVRHE
nr:MAG TPA: ATP:corrinoid adenosyltransferase [Caudoviricetes sp.]